MPTLSTFRGIVIRMYYVEHPPPHFHAIYGDDEAIIGIEALELLEGELPRPVMGRVLDWAELHKHELRDNWNRRQEHKRLNPIQPLE